MQIAELLGCARSTVYAYLRDFRLYRDHILRTVAADRLADQLYLLTYPDTQPEQHQRHIATTRELRLLLLNLPDIQQPERPDSPRISRTAPEHSETDSDSSRQIWTDLDKSGLEFAESPVPSNKSPKIIPKSRPPNEVRKILPDDSNDALADAYRGRLLVPVTPVHLAEVHLANRRPNPPLEIRCDELARMETDDG